MPRATTVARAAALVTVRRLRGVAMAGCLLVKVRGRAGVTAGRWGGVTEWRHARVRA
ncbi:hypothetical protein GCM10019017_57610 [Streptomyces showdoensis]